MQSLIYKSLYRSCTFLHPHCPRVGVSDIFKTRNMVRKTTAISSRFERLRGRGKEEMKFEIFRRNVTVRFPLRSKRHLGPCGGGRELAKREC